MNKNKLYWTFISLLLTVVIAFLILLTAYGYSKITGTDFVLSFYQFCVISLLNFIFKYIYRFGVNKLEDE